jgi:hypothetical protein
LTYDASFDIIDELSLLTKVKKTAKRNFKKCLTNNRVSDIITELITVGKLKKEH